MRSRPALTTAVTISAALTAAAVLARRSGRRSAASTSPAATDVAPAPVAGQDGVVLPFLRPAPPARAAVQEQPARCGATGGRTKSGAPCAARATASGRCHHHPLAA